MICYLTLHPSSNQIIQLEKGKIFMVSHLLKNDLIFFLFIRMQNYIFSKFLKFGGFIVLKSSLTLRSCNSLKNSPFYLLSINTTSKQYLRVIYNITIRVFNIVLYDSEIFGCIHSWKGLHGRPLCSFHLCAQDQIFWYCTEQGELIF